MILSLISIREVPQEVLKTSVFQHFPPDLVNVNEWQIMFDPSSATGSVVGEKLLCTFFSQSHFHRQKNVLPGVMIELNAIVYE